MTQEELVEEIQAGNNERENMAALWELLRRLVWKIAKRYTDSEPDVEDLTQEAYFGLCAAVRNYDSDSNVPFAAYASVWIRSAMQRYTEKAAGVHVPYNLIQKARQREQFISRYQTEHGQEPTREQIAAALGVTCEQLRKIETATAAGSVCSLEAPAGEDGGTLSDVIGGDCGALADVIEEVQAGQLSAVLWPLVDGLPGRCSDVIRARYKDGQTLKEIADREGLCIQSVAQWEKKGIKELRKPSRRRELEPYADDYIYTKAMQGTGVGTFRRMGSSTERLALRMEEMRELSRLEGL